MLVPVSGTNLCVVLRVGKETMTPYYEGFCYLPRAVLSASMEIWTYVNNATSARAPPIEPYVLRAGISVTWFPQLKPSHVLADVAR